MWQTDRQTNITKRTFPLVKFNVFDDMRRIWWSVWSWFDVNRSLFDEDIREKRLFYIVLLIDLDIWPLDLKCDPLVTTSPRYVSTELEFKIKLVTFSYFRGECGYIPNLSCRKIFSICYITTKHVLVCILTSGDYADTHEHRGIRNVHLRSHCTARWKSRHRYLTSVNLVLSCNIKI